MFLASSIVESLRVNTSLSINGLEMVICPIESCITDPKNCSKGHKETCEKSINIVYEHDGHNKVAILIFHYQLRGSNDEGYIRKEDLALNLLIDRGIVDRALLIAA